MPDDQIQAIYQLLLKQQRIGEDTTGLVDSIVKDLAKTREYGERLAIIASRLETLERVTNEWDRKRNDCSTAILQQLQAIEAKREQTKDRIAQLESTMAREVGNCGDRIRLTTDSIISPLEKTIGELREKTAFNAGKYGAVVALITSVLMMLLQYILTHPVTIPKP